MAVFLAQVTRHIPDKGQHLTRYYGWYSNVFRGRRAKADGEQGSESTYVLPAPRAHKRWAMLIKQVYEVDPLKCPECGGEMKVIAFIRDPRVIFRILDHLDLLESSGKDPPGDPPGSPLRYEPVFDDLPWGDDPFHVCWILLQSINRGENRAGLVLISPIMSMNEGNGYV